YVSATATWPCQSAQVSASYRPCTLKRSCATKGATAFLPSSSTSTPRTVKPLDEYFSCISISQGISIWQGSHQVAQKLTSTTLPLYWLNGTSWSSRSLNVTSGSGAPASLPLTSTFRDLPAPLGSRVTLSA